MTWLQIVVETDEDHADFVEGLLEDLGSLSITMVDAEDHPVLEPDLGSTPLWQKTEVIALFSSDMTAETAQNLLEQQGISASAIRAEIIENRDWEREWMTHFQPMKFGSRLHICPSWHPPSDDRHAVNLMLDPGLAFGTGTHPTTSLCLTWLDSQQFANKTLIDFGCGSGVLAVAALLLGASAATGVDIDPQALEASLANAERNGVETKLNLYSPEQLPDDLHGDIVIANILAKPLIAMASRLANINVVGGRIALSGILKEQEEEVCEAYRNYYQLNASYYQDDWVLITGTRWP